MRRHSICACHMHRDWCVKLEIIALKVFHGWFSLSEELESWSSPVRKGGSRISALYFIASAKWLVSIGTVPTVFSPLGTANWRVRTSSYSTAEVDPLRWNLQTKTIKFHHSHWVIIRWRGPHNHVWCMQPLKHFDCAPRWDPSGVYTRTASARTEGQNRLTLTFTPYGRSSQALLTGNNGGSRCERWIMDGNDMMIEGSLLRSFLYIKEMK